MTERPRNHSEFGSDEGQQQKLSLKLLREVCGTLGWRYALFVGAVILFGLSSLLPPQLFRYFTSGVTTLGQANASEFLIQFAGFGALVAVALLLSQLGHILCQEWLRLSLEAELRRRVLRRLHQIPLTALDGAQRGDWLTRMTGDLSQTEAFLTESIPTQIREIAIVLGAAALFFFYSGWLTLVPLGSAVVLALINVGVQRRLAPVLGELRTLHGGIFQLLLESLEGIRTIRSHSGEPYLQRHFEGKLQEITTKSMRVVRSLGALMGGTELVSKLLVTGCLSAAAYVLARGNMTVQDVLVYPFFIGMFYDAAQGLASNAYDWNRYFTQGGRLAELLYLSSGTSTHVELSSPVEWSEASRLSLGSLTIGHQGRALGPAFDFEVERGELVAVMGPSGSGKSTFLEVLAGLRPGLQGHATISDRRELCLWETSPQRALKLPIGPCAFVEQTPYIFEGTLRENLSFGNPLRLSDAVLWEALEKTSLYHFAVNREGLRTSLQDRGQNLSVGERYRIALTRALLLQRPFLLLDEPFAALDESSIRIVIHALTLEKARAGIVVVTHYLPEGLNPDGMMSFKDFRPVIFSKRESVGIAPAPVEARVASAGSAFINQVTQE